MIDVQDTVHCGCCHPGPVLLGPADTGKAGTGSLVEEAGKQLLHSFRTGSCSRLLPGFPSVMGRPWQGRTAETNPFDPKDTKGESTSIGFHTYSLNFQLKYLRFRERCTLVTANTNSRLVRLNRFIPMPVKSRTEMETR